MPLGTFHDMLMTVVMAISIGVLLSSVARRMGIPAIVLLLAGGVVAGPEVMGLVRPAVLGDGLRVIVSLAVGLILFEGGLTLELAGFRSAPSMIRRLLSVGALSTWFGTAAAAHLIGGLPLGYALVVGSMVIVTGPTVIAPLLERVRVREKLHSVLHWEGVLIDPIGVFIAVLCFEWFLRGSGGAAIGDFALRFVAGMGLGGLGGLVLYEVIERELAPADMLDGFALGFGVLIFGLAESLIAEAGLLSVTVAGFVVGARRPARLEQLRDFKAQLTDLAIGTLFLLLAARLELANFSTLGWSGLAVVAVVMFLVRPLNVLVCSFGLDVSWRERAFLAWVAPRGIVAASLASLIALQLEESGSVANPHFVETFTYSVIIGTIFLQAPTAGLVARALGVLRAPPTGWLIAGTHAFARSVARFLREEGGRDVLLLDTNVEGVEAARAEGLPALRADARDTHLMERLPEVRDMGYLLAVSDNEALNELLCARWERVLGQDHVFRWGAAGDARKLADAGHGRIVWGTLPRPSQVSGEIERGEAWMVWGRSPEVEIGADTRPLLLAGPGHVRLDPVGDGAVWADAETASLCLRREADYLLRALRLELVLFLPRADLETVLTLLVSLVTEHHPEVGREQSAIVRLLERETAFPTAIGVGVAVPHLSVPGLPTRLCAVACLGEGIDLGARDGVPVRLLFLVVGREGDATGHLATLRDIARLAADEEARAAMLAATDATELLRAVRRSHE